MSFNYRNQKLKMPRDVLTIKSILLHMGVKHYEPQVASHLLQFLYKYVTNILYEANIVKEHAKKEILDAEDIKMVISRKQLFDEIQRKEIEKIAKRFNRNGLANVKKSYGLKIPAERYSNSSCNYKLKTIKQIYLHRIYNQINEYNQLLAMHKQASMSQRPGIHSHMSHLTSILKSQNLLVKNQLSPYIKFNGMEGN